MTEPEQPRRIAMLVTDDGEPVVHDERTEWCTIVVHSDLIDELEHGEDPPPTA